MRQRRTILLLGAALALSACLGMGGKTPDTLLTLTPAVTVAAAESRAATAAETLSVAMPAVPQALNTLRVPVQTSDTSVAYLKDAQWVELPAALFGRLLSETIAAQTGRTVLDPRQHSINA